MMDRVEISYNCAAYRQPFGHAVQGASSPTDGISSDAHRAPTPCIGVGLIFASVHGSSALPFGPSTDAAPRGPVLAACSGGSKGYGIQEILEPVIPFGVFNPLIYSTFANTKMKGAQTIVVCGV